MITVATLDAVIATPPSAITTTPSALIIPNAGSKCRESGEHRRYIADSGEEEPSVGEARFDGIFAADLCTAMRGLPAKFRTAIYLTEIEGYTYRETAELMGSPVGTVMSRLHRARRSLQDSLICRT